MLKQQFKWIILSSLPSLLIYGLILYMLRPKSSDLEQVQKDLKIYQEQYHKQEIERQKERQIYENQLLSYKKVASDSDALRQKAELQITTAELKFKILEANFKNIKPKIEKMPNPQLATTTIDISKKVYPELKDVIITYEPTTQLFTYNRSAAESDRLSKEEVLSLRSQKLELLQKVSSQKDIIYEESVKSDNLTKALQVSELISSNYKQTILAKDLELDRINLYTKSLEDYNRKSKRNNLLLKLGAGAIIAGTVYIAVR